MQHWLLQRYPPRWCSDSDCALNIHLFRMASVCLRSIICLVFLAWTSSGFRDTEVLSKDVKQTYLDVVVGGRAALDAHEASALVEDSTDATGHNKCIVGLHTLIQMGDGAGGCFQHLEGDGSFKSAQDGSSYASKYCPFHGGSHQLKRKLMMMWYNITTTGNNVNGKASANPFTVNDVARTCILEGSDAIGNSFYMYFGGLTASDISKAEFCDAMLSLPAMFQAVGFDGPGLLLEDKRSVLRWTFHGWAQHHSAVHRPDPATDCFKPKVSPLYRLVLRALLPTYVRHVYSDKMMQEGIKNLLHIEWHPNNFAPQVEEVCNAARNGDVDSVMSFGYLAGGGLVNSEVLDRDEGTCDYSIACGYASRHQDSCKCYKAICWFFTDDFQAAAAYAEKLPACQNL